MTSGKKLTPFRRELLGTGKARSKKEKNKKQTRNKVSSLVSILELKNSPSFKSNEAHSAPSIQSKKTKKLL